MKKADIGLIGLAVMGENLVMNMESKGFTVAVYNRSADKVEKFTEGRAKGKNIIGCKSMEELVDVLEKPRKVMLMIRAGQAVDDMINQLLLLLEPGDVIIDGGNSFYKDTIRRTASVEGKGLFYIGTGVSGGEEGALNGPCLMPGGSEGAWKLVQPIFTAISAKVDGDISCCEWIGRDGAGHFVKMVHNGIEYGDMQLICEAYQMMRDGMGMDSEQMHQVFDSWNHSELDSYLMEITANIIGYKDGSGEVVVEKILDAAGQKGTGKWTCIAALDENVPLTLINEAVASRCISGMKEERLEAARIYGRRKGRIPKVDATFVEHIRKALYASKIISYAQGYSLMRAAAQTYGWNLKPGDIALIWRGGCIIRSAFLNKIKEAFDRNPELSNLILDPYFKCVIEECMKSWQKVVATAAEHGIPMPAMSAALNWFDSYTCVSLPANLLQAQRDYFGAHMYERIDRARGEMHHTNWTGNSGTTAAGTYSV